jgi:hypothetical protein
MFLDHGEWAEERESIADLGARGVIGAFFGAASGDAWAVGIPQSDPDVNARVRSVSEDAQDVCVLGQEQGNVGEDSDLAFG